MSTSTVINKAEKPKSNTTAATPKHKPLLNPTQADLKNAGLIGKESKKKPVAKKPAAEKTPEKKPDPAKAGDKKSAPTLTKEQEDANKRISNSHEKYNERIKAENAAKVEAQKESTSVAMSTDAFSKEILTEFHKRTKAIKSSIGKIDSSFETIAFNLHWINAKQAYKAEGHDTIVEYAAEQFGYQKSTCYSLISVVDRFAKRDEKGAFTETFEDRVKGFSVSKLSLMINLTDAEIDSLKPTMSVREIKKFVKGLSAKPLPELSEGDGEPPENEDDTPDKDNAPEDSGVVDVDAVVSNTLIKCEGKEDYEKKVGRIDEYILRIFKQHPNAVISVSYSVPKEEKKG